MGAYTILGVAPGPGVVLAPKVLLHGGAACFTCGFVSVFRE